ncbi:MAG: thiamine ABC transporter substrate-binding protein [Alkalispirochaetaceae bacterium]
MRMFVRLTLLATLFLLLGIAAVSASGATEGEQGEAEGPLVVYTYDAFPEALETVMVDYFRETLEEEVEFQRFADTGGLFNQLFLEREAPRADVAIGLDTSYLGRALEEEFFEPYRPEGADLLRPELVVDEEFRVTPFDYGGVTLNYNSELLPEPPGSWEELLSEEYRDSIILMNPNTSSPGRNFLLFTIAEFGEQGYLDFWEDLQPNILTITPGWSEGYGLYSQGEAPIVLSYETSPAYHLAYEDTDQYRPLIFDDEAYWQIEVAGIVRGTPRRELAEAFIDKMLSEEFQREIPLNQFMYPVRDDLELPEAFTAFDRAEEKVDLAPERVAEMMDQWLEEWEDTMR